MVQTYQSPVRVYKHPFELVMAAYHKRFPTCPQIPIFVGSDITHEWRSDDGAEEVIERKCQLNVDAPYLVKKIAGVDYVYFKQRNHLNMRQRTLLIEASNISFASRIVVIENCKYYVHTENPDWTCFEQSASLDVKSFFGFEAAVEKLAVKQYGANIAKGKEVLEYFIEELIKSGTTHVPRWSGSDGIKKDTLGADSAIDVSSTDGTESAGGKPELEHPKTAKGGEAITAMEKSPPSTPPASSSGFGSTSNAITDEFVNSPPLSGTAEEKLSTAELRRRRSSVSGPTAAKAASQAARDHAHQGANVAGNATVAAAKGAKAAVDRTKSFDDMESKLESEYIQRFLGQLTPLEESRLCQLKYGLQSMHKGKCPNDAHLLRFLRARDFDVLKATQMVLNSLLWRKQHKIDSLLETFVPPEVLLKYFPGGWHHNDKNGRPLFILRLGQMDIKGLLRSVGLEAIMKFTLSICEQGLIKTAEATNRLGKPISSWTLLVDLEGLSMRHLWRPGVQCLLRIIEIVEAHYPETMGLVLITRAPRAFPILWTLVSPFIDVNTRKKFELYASEDVLKELGRYIPTEFLPDFVGGSCHFEQSAAAQGPPWTVPKSEYLSIPTEELLRESAEDCLPSTYTAATVNKGLPYEIYVWNAQAGSVLTWDFDIIKGECEFIIYHSEKKISAPPKHSAAGTTGTSTSTGTPAASGPGPVERVVDELSNLLSPSTATIPHFNTIISEPSFRVGAELSVAERMLNFSEGDSMQGSHFCAKPGTYILQWRHPADAHRPPADGTEAATTITAEGQAAATTTTEATNPSEKAQQQQHKSTGTAHKCRLMVYHEMLDSADFKGSVASLQSCRSSFNSLAAAESLHSSNPNSPNAKQRVRQQQQQKKTTTNQEDQQQKGQKQQQTEDEEEDTTTDQTPKAE